MTELHITWVVVDNTYYNPKDEAPVRVHYVEAPTAQQALEEVLIEQGIMTFDPLTETLRHLHPTVAQLVRPDRVLTAIEYWPGTQEGWA